MMLADMRRHIWTRRGQGDARGWKAMLMSHQSPIGDARSRIRSVQSVLKRW
jgi:hypothetical protein